MHRTFSSFKVNRVREEEMTHFVVSTLAIVAHQLEPPSPIQVLGDNPLISRVDL